MIPQRMIDEVRQSADIVDIVSDYVKLHPSGRHFKGLSPFAQEKTPSFIVSPDKQIYKCFSSGKGGNVFTFIMEMEKVSFPEAVEILAKRTGIDVSRLRDPSENKTEKSDDSWFETLRWAARLFHHTLESRDGLAAYAYLTAKRGLLPETVKRFGLGYAPDSWDFLRTAADKEKIPVTHLTALGLLTRHPERNSLYDTMRHRIIFPIFTIGGQVTGFGGRTLSNDTDTPKYLNSPESATFEKSKLLYGMHAAKNEIRRQEFVILVEGYMDVIALHQAGFVNTVASCGTSLTRYQAKILQRHTRRVLFLYDGDNAGKKSMLAGIDILLSEGLIPWIVMLPSGEDPDSFVRSKGKEAFMQVIEKQKLPFQDFQLLCYRDAGALDSPEQKSRVVTAMTKSIAHLPDPVQKELYLEELSKKLDLNLTTLRRVISSGESLRPDRNTLPSSSKTGNPQKKQPQAISVTGRTFLEALLESTYYGNEVLAFAASHEQMLRLDSIPARTIFNHLVERYRKLPDKEHHHIDIAAEISSIGMQEAQDLALDILLRLPVREPGVQLPDITMQHARRCLSHFLVAVKTLVLEPLQQERHDILARLAGAAEKSEETQLFMRLHELNNLIRSTDQEVSSSINTILES